MIINIKNAKDLLKSPRVLFVIALLPIIATYDGVFNQLNLPKISYIFGIGQSFIPWWMWIIIFEAVVLYIAFEYLRQILGYLKSIAADQTVWWSGLNQKLDARDFQKITPAVEKALMSSISNEHDLKKLKEDIDRRFKDFILLTDNKISEKFSDLNK